jgi:nitrite reductase/ring-hydroxylating ferredoxin subunit
MSLRVFARRIGTAHALVDTGGLTLNVLSRRAPRGHRGLGRALSMALNGGKPVGVELEGESVVISRSEESGEVCAIAATCSHLGGPLAEGKRDGETVVCSWHGFRLDLCSGEVRGGPAVYPQPRYETRVRSRKVEIRLAKDDDKD